MAAKVMRVSLRKKKNGGVRRDGNMRGEKERIRQPLCHASTVEIDCRHPSDAT
jgi:hypothetical protein